MAEARKLIRSYSEIGCGDVGKYKKCFRRDTAEQVKKIQSKHQIRRNPISQISKGSIAKSLEKKLCSKSLTDLLGYKSDEEEVGSRSQRFYQAPKSEILHRRPNSEISGLVNECKTVEAGRRILTVLMLNAWRRQREENKETEEGIKNLASQIESLQMQLYVLRQLLDTEKARVASTNEELHSALNNLQDCQIEKANALKGKAMLESKIDDLEKRLAQLEDQCRNQKNELITIRAESENWEKQLRKEREKLKKAEDEKKALKDEVFFREDVIMCQTKSLEQLTHANKELQNKLDAQVPIWNETVAQINAAHEKIACLEEIQRQQEKTIFEKEERIRKLHTELVQLKEKLLVESEKNGELSKFLLTKSEELDIVQEKLKDLSSSHISWGGRVIKIASICAKVPFACFYTLAILLLPIPPCESGGLLNFDLRRG